MADNNNDNQGYIDENQNNAVRKKRRRKPNTDEKDDAQPEIPTEEQTIPKKEPRRRRRREAKTQEDNIPNGGPLGVAAYLEDLQDDIELKMNSDTTLAGATSGRPPMPMGGGVGGIGGTGGTGDKVYIEGARTFRVESHDKFVKNQRKMMEKQQSATKLGSIYDQQYVYDNDLLQCSIGVTDRFRIFATFLHGLFAGMTLIHMIFSLTIGGTSTTSKTTFVASYAMLQQPLSIYNYVAFIIILVSLWDRIDVGEPSRFCGPPQAGILVALILAMVAFVINNCQYMYNQDFNNFVGNNSRSFLDSLVVSYNTWRVLDAVKSVLICVSWFIVALVPIYDRFVEHLKACLTQDLNENY